MTNKELCWLELESLLSILPETVYNCESFGLMLCKVSDGQVCKWECKYYSHFSNKSDDRFIGCISSDPCVAVRKLIMMYYKYCDRDGKRSLDRRLYDVTIKVYGRIPGKGGRVVS